MTDNAQGPANRQLRMLLIEAGLTESETDAFIYRLRLDYVSGAIQGQEARLKLVERILDDLSLERMRDASTVGRIKQAIGTIILGAAGSALWDLLKSDFTSVQLGAIPPWNGEWTDDLITEWVDAAPWKGCDQAEQLFRTSLEIRRQRYRRTDKRIAVAFDSLGMCLDGQRKHRSAEKCRRQALAIAESLGGVAGQLNLGAGLSNLGVCLVAQHRYGEGDKLFRKSMKVLSKCAENNHIFYGVAVFNLYMSAKKQGLFLNHVLPQQFKQAEPVLHKANEVMTQRKQVLVTVDAMKELLEKLKEAVTLLSSR